MKKKKKSKNKIKMCGKKNKPKTRLKRVKKGRKKKANNCRYKMPRGILHLVGGRKGGVGEGIASVEHVNTKKKVSKKAPDWYLQIPLDELLLTFTYNTRTRTPCFHFSSSIKHHFFFFLL